MLPVVLSNDTLKGAGSEKATRRWNTGVVSRCAPPCVTGAPAAAARAAPASSTRTVMATTAREDCIAAAAYRRRAEFPDVGRISACQDSAVAEPAAGTLAARQLTPAA